MIKYVVGFITGVYVAQQFRDQVPDITKVINGIKSDVETKINEYNKNDKK